MYNMNLTLKIYFPHKLQVFTLLYSENTLPMDVSYL